MAIKVTTEISHWWLYLCARGEGGADHTAVAFVEQRTAFMKQVRANTQEGIAYASVLTARTHRTHLR